MARKKSKAFGAKFKKVEKIKKANPFDSIFKKNNNTLNKNASIKSSGTDIRRQTLAVEFNNMGKVNKIVDKRVAERDFNLTAQEKAEKRFILQRKKLFASKNMFNLSDDESNDESGDDDLHFRKNLKERPKTDDDVGGELDSDLVALANFGGGSFNAQLRQANLIKTEKPSRKEIMQNLIQIRRQNKEQRQQEKEEQEENTDKLNDLFVNLQKSGDLLTRKRGETNAETRDKMDAYDSLYCELQFDPLQKTAKPEPFKKTTEAKIVEKRDTENDNAPQGSLKMLEPRFEENYQSGGLKAKKNTAKNKLKTMRQRLKKETRGAVKELRKDAKFLAKMQNERDQTVRRERKEKTKNILANLQVQESEYKKRTLKKF